MLKNNFKMEKRVLVNVGNSFSTDFFSFLVEDGCRTSKIEFVNPDKVFNVLKHENVELIGFLNAEIAYILIKGRLYCKKNNIKFPNVSSGKIEDNYRFNVNNILMDNNVCIISNKDDCLLARFFKDEVLINKVELRTDKDLDLLIGYNLLYDDLSFVQVSLIHKSRRRKI